MINSSVFIAKPLALDSPASSLSNLSNSTSSSIESLPLELQAKILSYLPLSENLRTRQVSHSFKSFADNPWLWRQQLMQYFPDWQQLSPSEEIKQVVGNEDYKVLFIQLYQQHFGKLEQKHSLGRTPLQLASIYHYHKTQDVLSFSQLFPVCSTFTCVKAVKLHR